MALRNFRLFQPKPTFEELEKTVSSLLEFNGDEDKLRNFINQSVRNSEIGAITGALEHIESERNDMIKTINALKDLVTERLQFSSSDDALSMLEKLIICLDKNPAYIPSASEYGIQEKDTDYFLKRGTQFLQLFKKLDLFTRTINLARTALTDVKGQLADESIKNGPPAAEPPFKIREMKH